MSKEIKPIKRSRQLTSLSKDHHDGLLLVWKIRQGLKNGTDEQMIADYVKWFWANYLNEHFREEEEILAPFLKENELIKRMLNEHNQINAMIDGNLHDEKSLEQLAVLLNDHIRFEERVLFPFAETMINEESLDKIESLLIKEKKECAIWENEFWIRK